MDLNILEYILLESEGAPLKKALLDAGIGKDIFGSFDGGILQPVFSIIAKNSDPDKKEEFKRVVYDTLNDIVKNGIDKIGLIGAIVMIGVNVGTYYYHKAIISPYLSFFSYLVRMNKSVDEFCKIRNDELKEYQEELQVIGKTLQPLRKHTFLFAQNNISGSFFDVILDYVKMIFHVITFL